MSLCSSSLIQRWSSCTIHSSTTRFKTPYFGIRLYSKKHNLTQAKLKRYCNLLGIPINASEAKIKQGFYKKSLLYHPDRSKDSESAHQFKQISEAYTELIAYKRQDKNTSNNLHSSAWKKDFGRPVRQWYQSKKNSRTQWHSPRSENFDENDFKTNSTQEKQATLQQHSNASNWCDEFYKKQLKEDSEQHHLKKRASKNVKRDMESEENKTCSIM